MFDCNFNSSSSIWVILRRFRPFSSSVTVMKHEISVSCQVRQQKGAGVTQSRARIFRETLRVPGARRATPTGWYCISGKWWLCAKPAMSLSDQERGFSSRCHSHSSPLQTLGSLMEPPQYRLVVG